MSECEGEARRKQDVWRRCELCDKCEKTANETVWRTCEWLQQSARLYQPPTTVGSRGVMVRLSPDACVNRLWCNVTSQLNVADKPYSATHIWDEIHIYIFLNIRVVKVHSLPPCMTLHVIISIELCGNCCALPSRHFTSWIRFKFPKSTPSHFTLWSGWEFP